MWGAGVYLSEHSNTSYFSFNFDVFSFEFIQIRTSGSR